MRTRRKRRKPFDAEGLRLEKVVSSPEGKQMFASLQPQSNICCCCCIEDRFIENCKLFSSKQICEKGLQEMELRNSATKCDQQLKLPTLKSTKQFKAISLNNPSSRVRNKHNLFTILLALLTFVTLSNRDIFKLTNCYQARASTRFPLPVQTSNFQTRIQQTIFPEPQSQSPIRSPIVSTLTEFISYQGGIIKTRNITLNKQLNPIVIRKDIIIQKDSRLIIEPGTEILFDKRKGIIVHGTLDILGKPEDKVKLNLLRSTSSATINFRSHNNNPTNQQVRLVDGDLPNEGRVQIKFNDRWHSLCTNSKNLTSADIKVICNQVGYQDGHWYKWFPKRNGTLYQIMSKTFLCNGNELAITQCKLWNYVRAGGGICDNHSDIGVRCSRTLNFGTSNSPITYDYWRGIEFINSESTHEFILDGQMKQKVSRSTLKHVVFSEAGMNEVGNATSAIKVTGQPPIIDNIEIRNSVYGIIMEDVDDAIKLSNIRLTNNMASPLFINTSWGKVVMDSIHVENNGGDGIRVARHEKVSVGINDFCKFANLRSEQTYPVTLSHEQAFFAVDNVCCQEFISDNQLTVHFPVLRSTPNNLLPESDSNKRVSIPAGVSLGKDAHLIIHDDYREEFAYKLRIQNNTRAQSIVSKTGRLKICYEPALYRSVLFTIEVVAEQDDVWSGLARDVEISNSFVKGNEGRGIWIENPRSGVILTNTTVLNHNYLSGVHIENGTGQVVIQGGSISNNTGHGLFIDLAGGYYHIDNATISDNTQKGILIEYDQRPQLVAFNYTMHLGYSLLARNGENGIFIGNVCRSDAFWNISMNSFSKNGEDAIRFQSCWPNSESIVNFRNLTSRLNLSDSEFNFHSYHQELLITHNVFQANIRRALHVAPIYFLKSFIRHNLFKDHQLAVMYVSNQEFLVADKDSAQAPVNMRIASNRFYRNRGRYVVNIGVQEDNSKHSIVFTRNTLEDNTISEPYVDLRPRSRVSAVVVVSSSNTKVIRNRFNNPNSPFELGCHLEMHSKVINATTNFWGHNLDAMSIYRRIFDRKNRYNLAQVEFLQYLISQEDLEYATDLSFDRERDKISTFRNGTRLGGEVKGYEDLPPDTYIVQDDIFVRSAGHLILRPGTVLKFLDGVGMMVQGRLDAFGSASSQIIFTSAISTNRLSNRVAATTTPAPSAIPWISYQSETNSLGEEKLSNDRNNITSTNDEYITRRKRQANFNYQNVRLSHYTMGRLEVNIDGVWGPVCDYNFDIDDAAVVCQQLEMILNKDDWLLEKFQYASNDQQQLSMMTTNVLMTNLRCDPSLDTDITKCKAEVSLRGEFDGMCNSEVGIRCFPPSWSGLRIGMGAETSTLEHIIVQKAGMFDYASYSLKPALRIDLNRHRMSSVIVRSNSDSGLGIMWNDVIGRHSHELLLSDSKFFNNERHGIELRSKGLNIRSCSMSSNRQNGLDYNPSLSREELLELTSWLYTTKNVHNIVQLAFPLRPTSKHYPVPSTEDSFRFFVFQKDPQPDIFEHFTIGTDPGHMLSIQILNPIHPESTETLNMTIGTNPEHPTFNFRTNITSFPMISPGYKFHFNYSTGRKPLGNMILYIRSRYNNRDLKLLSKHIPPHLMMHKFELTAQNINSKLINSLTISNSNITKNAIGLKFRHPNLSEGPNTSYNLRYSNETTNITNNIFEANHFSSIFVGSDDYELFSPETANNKTLPASEIYYNILNNKIRRNKDGIRQFSRDVRQSFNIFHWSINDTIFEYNKGGGINLVLPYYWRYDLNLSHTIEMNNNTFFKNNQFELTLDGHFAILNMTNNNLKENKCKSGLISIGGMEKRMIIARNTIEFNSCNRIVEFNIQSHADKMGLVEAKFCYNSLRFNRKSNSSYTPSLSNFKYPKLFPKLHPQASDFALGLRGVQLLNITRNLFVNPDLRFELVVGIMMDPNEKTVNAVENYWGSVLYPDVSERIFDSNDWNSYAVAEVSPLLTLDSFTAATILLETRDFVPMSNGYLGGRLIKSLSLPYRKEPYIVESDLTVMPNVRLTIEKGVTLEFMPNVGILVLGDLIAAGTRERPIQMRPALGANDIMPLYNYLFPNKTKSNFYRPNYNDQASYDQNYILKHMQLAYPIDLGSLRLCKNEICNDGTHIYENNVEDPTLRQEILKTANNSWRMDGFLEIYNMTTLQWVPVCDPLFTEHTAKVACKQLGYSQLTLFKRGRRYTFEQEQISSIKHWPESVICEGEEMNLANCPLALTGYNNHSAACHKDSNQFIYLYCQDFPESTAALSHGMTNEHLHHWGGIRFSCPSTVSSENNGGSSHQDNNRDNFNMINDATNPVRSRLQYVLVDKAGMLHRKKSPAVQIFQCNVQIEFTAITNSSHHGLEVIASQGNQNFHQLRLRNNLGVGFNYLPLTGSSSASRLVPYLPLKHLDFSNDIFGLVDICGANKEILIEERMLLFYRYGSEPVDCIKIITSKLRIKHIGIRMLQFDMFNSTLFSPKPDYVKIYDGNIFDRDSRLLIEMGVTEKHRIEKPELKFYQTSDNTMSIRLHASGAGIYYGFIAEVVTTPVSYNIQRDTYNNITFSEITNNKLGALSVGSAGESSPNLILKNNRFEDNCLHLFGNFTSCVSPIYMELQNCQKLKFINNLIRNNQGGLTIKSYSHSAVSALDASIDNNVFESNYNANTLALLGPKTDPYQTVKVSHNIFTRNFARYLSDIVLSRIVANFSNNLIAGNTGKHNIEVIGFDKLPLSYQTFSNNWIYNNTATFERDKSTIFGNSAGQQYHLNYLVNPDNHFEISTMNWSRYDVKPFGVSRDDEIIHLASGDGSTKDVFRKTADSIPISIVDTKKLDIYNAAINAKQNWWGLDSAAAIRNRIRDRYQHEELIKVDFAPYLESNKSVLSGICAGGWQKVGQACLVYVGIRMNYHEAKDFCDQERATLTLMRGNHYEISDFVQSQDRDFDPRVERIWVRSFDVSRDSCPAVNDYRTRKFNCMDKNPFLCEKDPIVVVSLLHWDWETGGVVSLIFSLFTMVLLLCCSICSGYKMRHKQRERIRRKNSIYASMRSNRGPYCASNNSLSELFLHRQIYSPEKTSITDLSLSTQLTQPSHDESNLSRLEPHSIPQRDRIRSRTSTLGPTSSKAPSSSYYQSGSLRSKPIALNHEPQPSYNPSYQSSSPHPITTSPSQQRTQYRPVEQSKQYVKMGSSQSIRNIIQEESRGKDNDSSYQSKQSINKSPTPVPSYKEVHPRALSSNGSRTPSYSGSNLDGVLVEPMPLLLPVYTHINHAISNKNNFTLNRSFKSTLPNGYSGDEQVNESPSYVDQQPHNENQSYQFKTNINSKSQMRNIDESESSVPTYYSNQIDVYEGSSQPSYYNLTAYDDTLDEALQNMNSGDIAYVITEKSSIIDQTTKTSTINSRQDIISMNPIGSSADFAMENFYNQTNTAYSESGGGSQCNNRYLVETSFDLDDNLDTPPEKHRQQTDDNFNNILPNSMFGSSQRLSQESLTYGLPDSKQGSRVYLETSFE